jgi:response regulator RpfG family c-di-GMP phosphodiesterase
MRRISVGDIKPGMSLARSVFSGSGHLLLSAGTEITERYVAILRARGFSYVDIHDPDTDDIEIEDIISERTRMNVTVSTYRILNAVGNATSAFRNQDFGTIQGEISSDAFARQAREAFGYEELVSDVADIVDEVAAQAMLPGIQTLRSFDNYQFLHSIDTTIVALMVGRRLGFDRARLHQLAAGCILHDIGMVMVDAAVLTKPGRLDPGEMAQIHQHPRLGYDMLRQMRPRQVIPNHVAYQHHERQDGSGYPRGLQGSGRISRSEAEKHRPGRILLDAEICAVADVYDALGADRPWRPALPPDQLVYTLRSMAGSQLNTEVVGHLLEILPVYPLGSEVVVRTGPFSGYRGVVARVDRRQLDRPVVRLLFDKTSRRMDPVELDLTRDDAVIASVPGAAQPAVRPSSASSEPQAAPAGRPGGQTPAPVPNTAVARAASGAAEAAERMEEAPKPARVLVVDDDPLVIGVLTDALEEAGYTVVPAESGREGLSLAPTADIVLLDLGLPDMDGMTVCKAMRVSPELARVPVMMLTARGEPVDRVRGIQSGADDYLAKPFDLDEVLARVEALLRSRQIEVALRERNRQLDVMRKLVSSLVDSTSAGELPQRIVDAVPDAFGPNAGVLGAVVSSVDAEQRIVRGHALTRNAEGKRALDLLRRPLAELSSVYDPPRNLQHEAVLRGEPRGGAHLAELVAPTVSPALALAIERAVGMRGAVAYPTRARGRTVGVLLFVLSKPVEQVTPTERTLMSELADTAGIALEDARVHAPAGQAAPTG